MKNRFKILVICIFLSVNVYSQLTQFSQFYSSPAYLNPAFTGANVCSRLSLNYRKQWSGIPGNFSTYMASFDHYFEKYKSGVGLQVLNDKAGVGGLSTTQISFLYAYEARLNNKFTARGGLSVGNIQRKTEVGDYIFADQIARGSGGTTEQLQNSNKSYFDFGAGIIVYSSRTWWGISGAHLNKPNQAFMNGISALPPEVKFHGGYKIILKEGDKEAEPEGVTIAFNLRNQNKFNQLDIGAYYSQKYFVAGVWYRGIPILKPEQFYKNNDAIIFLGGINFARFKIGYSYDMTLSELSNASTKGAHEVSMSYQFCNPNTAGRRTNVKIASPKF